MKLFIIIIFVIAIITLFVFGIRRIRSGINFFLIGKASIHWPVTRGKIILSITKEQVSYFPEGISEIIYEPIIHFIYKVKYEELEGDRIFIYKLYSDQRFCFNLIKEYPVGKIVKVFYNPIDPDESVLKPGLTIDIYFLFLTGFISITLAFFLLFNLINKQL